MENNQEFNPQALKERLAQTDQLISEVRDYLVSNGIEYKLGEWLTIKRYCQKFEIKNVETVMNWIRRGIVPPENVVELEELNGLKLIRAVKYMD